MTFRYSSQSSNLRPLLVEISYSNACGNFDQHLQDMLHNHTHYTQTIHIARTHTHSYLRQKEIHLGTGFLPLSKNFPMQKKQPISNYGRTCYLFPNERHYSDSCEHMLTRQSLSWNSVSKGFCVVSTRFTEMAHEE